MTKGNNGTEQGIQQVSVKQPTDSPQTSFFWSAKARVAQTVNITSFKESMVAGMSF